MTTTVTALIADVMRGMPRLGLGAAGYNNISCATCHDPLSSSACPAIGSYEAMQGNLPYRLLRSPVSSSSRAY